MVPGQINSNQLDFFYLHSEHDLKKCKGITYANFTMLFSMEQRSSHKAHRQTHLLATNRWRPRLRVMRAALKTLQKQPIKGEW